MRTRTALAAGALTVLALFAGGGTAVAGGATAEGIAAGSPGVLSGNQIQIPVHIPINICGNSINVLGALNPAFGNTCVNA
ncbi:chaplin [Kitasatospora sp. NPDC093806]|uniref:chaplin n=1 Tax=Kitasatospora sp. NPDC093806 TaxID=3155075 RepID=UPI003413B2DE